MRACRRTSAESFCNKVFRCFSPHRIESLSLGGLVSWLISLWNIENSELKYALLSQEKRGKGLDLIPTQSQVGFQEKSLGFVALGRMPERSKSK